VDWYLDALRACPAQREGCAGARDGALFEAAALLTGRDRELATVERLTTLGTELVASLGGDTPAEVQVALAGLAALGAALPVSRPILVRLGAPSQVLRVLADDPGARERGRGLMALGTLFADEKQEGRAQAAVLIRAGLDDEEPLVRRQAVVAATLLGDDGLHGDLLRRLLLDVEPGRPQAGKPGASPVLTPTALPPPPATLPPERAEALLPLLPAYMHMLLSMPGPEPAAYALGLARAVAKARPQAAVAHFFLARAADRAADPEALPALRRALALGNLPGNFLSELGTAGRSLIEPTDAGKGRAQVRALLMSRPPWMAQAQDAAPRRVLRPGQARPRPADPVDLERRVSAFLRRVAPADSLDGEEAQRLGAEIFAAYPFGSDAYYDGCLRSFLSEQGDNRDLLPRLGLVSEREGAQDQIVGVVAARVEGKERLGVTCALCHTQVDEAGRRWDGLPTKTYDQGLLLAACVEYPIHHKSGNRNQAELLAFGPGRNDSTSDGVNNPTDIPSLYGLRTGRAVRWSGDTPTLEVQIDRNLSPHSAPPGVVRVLAAYLRRLPLPPAEGGGDAALLARGAEVFAAACARCHRGEAMTTGEVVPLAEVGTEGTRLLAVLPNSTPGYKVPSLLRIGRGAPYLHDGSVPTLEALLSPKRKGGHRYGLGRSAADRAALLAYLRTR
jgi:mono/diheme cytochrome c family protein